MVGLQFTHCLQQENRFQSFIPVRDHYIETAAGDLFHRAEDFRASFDFEFKIRESETQGA